MATRVSQVSLEVLRQGTAPTTRVTQVALEVLRTVANAPAGSIVPGAADGLLAFRGEAVGGRVATVWARGTLTFDGEAAPAASNIFPDILGPPVLGDPLAFVDLGYYYFDTILDLGDPYERVRFSVEIEGTGSQYFLSGLSIPSDDWNAWVEISGAGELPTLSTWLALDDGTTRIPVDFDGDSVVDLRMVGLWDESYIQWTDWQPVTVAEITGRIFRFRLVLANTSVIGHNVTPIISSCRITVDMQDRDERGSDILIAPGGLAILFQRRFAARPSMGIALEDAAPGSFYKLTDIGPFGFTIELFNAGGTTVGGQVDWIARGYGRGL